ncbi:delta(3,5)-Delta(2,4)-dienoyl-CoA isomerase, mitochondrial-like [Halichondria panicea]|uniref:delta(3,5)-Delta(2,4)-dienoyl-CoA isomerase, mitochondrial-like n=1 Tax=Halichondria panicea TaxID=6063 RepID=UPI00312B312F
MATLLRRAFMATAKPVRIGMYNTASLSTQATAYETLLVTHPSPYVTKVTINRPDKSNAMNTAFWTEIKECFDSLSVDPDCRVVMVTGAGKNFTAGLDLVDFAGKFSEFSGEGSDVGRKAMAVRRMAKPMQDSFTALEKCSKPVIAVIHGACVGGGVDMVTACDIRLASQDAFFQIKEVELGLAADVGTLQRLPKVVGNDSLVRELVYSARRFTAQEAHAIGMLSDVYESRESAESAGLSLAETIASKSPVAVQGSKVNLVYSRDNTVDNGLEYALTWNSAMLQSEDLLKAAQAAMTKETPVYSKL